MRKILQNVFKDKPQGHCLIISEGTTELINQVDGFIQLNEIGTREPYLYGYYDRGNERILVIVNERDCVEQAIFIHKDQLEEILQ